MPSTPSEKTEQKQALWQKGGPSPNPSGRPKGALNRTTLAIQSLLANEGEQIARKAVELALKGDRSALKCVLDRVSPPMKSAPIEIGLPEIASVQDSLAATSKVIQAVACGEITPQEGITVVNLLEKFAKTLEISELEQRISNLEKHL